MSDQVETSTLQAFVLAPILDSTNHRCWHDSLEDRLLRMTFNCAATFLTAVRGDADSKRYTNETRHEHGIPANAGEAHLRHVPCGVSDYRTKGEEVPRLPTCQDKQPSRPETAAVR
jgi:hypothetical protein